eukprot:TRINITY_DN10284_c0_g1_i1.p1 TRINITY_DN10284_c0_g1~~TRINITY_DN10284_c0_g1_i1.p1  ORF type:complete len:355 (-),score=101.16 TRINITY_DN10284_c0_g1_i1:52-1029(-)
MDHMHRNLMVNYIPNTWTEREMRAFFEAYGVVEDAKVIVDKNTGASKGYGFVKFVTKEDAESCIAHAHGTQVEDNKRLNIHKAELGRLGQAGGGQKATLYVAGFDPSIFPQSEIQKLFSDYGTVTQVKMQPPQPGKKGVAFVHYTTLAEASNAAANVNGATVGTDVLTVRLAHNSNKDASASAQDYLQRAMLNYGGGQGVVVGSPWATTMPVGMGGPARALLSNRFQPYPRGTQQAVTSGNQPQPNTNDGSYCLFVYGVKGMDDSFLYKLFGPFGAVTSASAPREKNFGFVNMPNYFEAMNAINSLNGTRLEGVPTPLQVSLKSS